MKRFFDSLNSIYGPLTSGSSPMLSLDGTKLITDKTRAEHFDGVLNRPSSKNDAAIQRLPLVAINPELDIPPLRMRLPRQSGECRAEKPQVLMPFPQNVFKSGGSALLTKLTEQFKSFRDNETLSQEFKDASIVHINCKRKENKRSCDNHRGISPLAIAGKILVLVLLNRLLKHLEQGHLPQSQCGFRTGRGTIDMVFATRQLQEKSFRCQFMILPYNKHNMINII